jgi:hypothetical protein
MKQTAVEWLGKELESYGDPQFCAIEWEQLDLLIQQAKEMEKEQIIKEFDNALDSEFGKAKLALKEYLLENKEKVANDLDEMRIKSNQNNMKEEIFQFLDKLYALCWEYHIEIKPTHPVPNDEYPTISIINGDEVVKLLYVDGDGET